MNSIRQWLAICAFAALSITRPPVTRALPNRLLPAESEPPAVPVEVADAERKSIAATVTASAVLYPCGRRRIVPRSVLRCESSTSSGAITCVPGNFWRRLRIATWQRRHRRADSSTNRPGDLPEHQLGATLPTIWTTLRADARSAREALDAAKKVYESRVKLLQEGALGSKAGGGCQSGHGAGAEHR